MSSTLEFEQPKESLLQTLMPVIILTLICAISGATLAAVKIGTAEQIENQLLANIQGPTLRKMYPQADNDPIAERKKIATPSGDSVVVFPVYEKGNLSSVAIEGIGTGYGGDLGVMVGFNLAAGNIRSIGVTLSKETPGIGTQIQDGRFTKQFSGKKPSVSLRPDGGEIDAISGATISSKGAIIAVQNAGKNFESLRPEIEKTWPVKK